MLYVICIMRTDTSSDIKELLEENIKLSKEILHSSEKTRKYMRWMQVASFLRLLIFIIPLVLAILYIPPFLINLSKTFSNLYGGEQFNILEQFKNPAGGLKIDIEDIKKLLNQGK